MDAKIGIDISKASFDAHDLASRAHTKYANKPGGFRKLIKKLPANVHVVMEASGPYYLPLAMYLHQNGVKVSVVNPLQIKRYSQMRLNRTKTDKKDAKLIAQYAANQQPELWEPPAAVILQINQLFTAISLKQKQLTALGNQQKAFKASGVSNPMLQQELTTDMRVAKDRINRYKDQMQHLCKQHYSQSFGHLRSIPSIGPMNACMLIALTHNFTRFQNQRQLAAYVGLCPGVFESGSSVKGKGHICKLGAKLPRQLLYLAALTAKRGNSACKELYERMLAKGKPKKVALIAVAHKLLIQAFHVGTKQEDYRPVKMTA
jgi:transposase